MDISLTPELQQFVAEALKTGRFRSASEVINRAVALLREEEQLGGEGLVELRRQVQAGLDEADREEFGDWTADEIKAEGRRRLAGLRAGR